MSSNNNTGSPNSGSSNAKINSNLGTAASRYATPEVNHSNGESPKAKSTTSDEVTKVQVSRKGKEKARDSVSHRGDEGKATASGRVSNSFLESVDSSGDSSCEPLDDISDIEGDNMDIDPLDMSDLEESTFIKTSLVSYRIEVGKLTKELTLAIGRNENPAKIGTLQKELDRASKALEILIRSEKLMDSAEPSTPKVTHAFVPPQLPITFQWRGMIVNRREYKYREQHPSDCFKRFEGILKSHGMSLDLNWKRLLPECLVNKEMFQLLTTFLKDQYADHTYDRFKRVFIGHFGRNEQDEKVAAANKLLSMDMSRYGSLELYTEKFNKYRALSGLTDETMLVARYLNGLMSALRKDINKCLIASGDAARSLEQIITIARRLVLSEHYENITMKRNKRDESRDEDSKSKKARNVRKCKNHPNATDHFTRDCRIPKKGKKGDAKPPGVCWRCLKAPFPGDHKCVPASKKNDKTHRKQSKKHDEESDSESGESNNSDSMDTDEEDEADKKFASMSMASINKE